MTGRRNPISTDAGAIAEQLRKKRAQRKMPPTERREARRQARRHKVTYDIPTAVTDAVKSVAEREGISASAVAALFLAHAVYRYSEGQLSLDDVVRRKSSSPRWPRVVDDEYVLAVLRGSQILGGNES